MNKLINKLYRFLTKAIGMETTCCRSEKYSVIENCPVCMNESCNNYLGQTNLKSIFTISYSIGKAKTGQ